MKSIVAYFVLFSLCLGVSAQNTKDPEDDHVRITLTDGTQVEGYVKDYWVSGKLFKRLNTSFTMSPKPDGKDAVS